MNDIIEKHSKLLEGLWEISFTNNNFTLFDLNNFNEMMSNKILKSERKIGTEQLIIQTELDNNIFYKINTISNIKEYINGYKNNISINRKEIIENEDIDNEYDYSFSSKVIIEQKSVDMDKKDDLLDINLKKFKFIQYIEYETKEVIYVATISKKTEKYYKTIKESKLFKEKEEYNFKIYIKNKKTDIHKAIKTFIFAINGNIMPLKKELQETILEKYSKLIKPLFDDKLQLLKNEIILITPKPITLERTNLGNPDTLGLISILRNYAVTEKADGERYLLYINDEGIGYLISSSYEVRGTKLINTNLKNSLFDGELVICKSRKDNVDKDLFAIFDIYILNKKLISELPLIDGDNKSRYLEMEKNIKEMENCVSHEFIIKKQKVLDKNNTILDICKNILEKNDFKYAIDGLIFTPTKLPVLSIYANKPVKFSKNMKWDKVFKWKPPEQNTIDFIIKSTGKIKSYGSFEKYKEFGLFVGYNLQNMKVIEVLDGLNLRYNSTALSSYKKNDKKYELRQLIIDDKLQYSHIKINEDGNCYTSETEELIIDNTIIEFSYNKNISNISHERKWTSTRNRIDKNKIYKYGKGKITKTANDWDVAMNIWRSIMNPISINMIKGNEELNFNLSLNMELTSEDKYYNRGSERNNLKLISKEMNRFHNLIIKKQLYESQPLLNNTRGSLLELACGQGGDLNRWLDSKYENIVGIDFVKDNITNPMNGIYKRYIEKFKYIPYNHKEKFPDMIFLIGDCGKNIKSGESGKGLDKDSENIMKILLNKKKKTIDNKYIFNKDINNKNKNILDLDILNGRFENGFNVVSCMFSIHYFFETENILDEFLKNVETNLQKGGKFITTFMDGLKVEKLLENNNFTKGIDTKSGSIIWAIVKKYRPTQVNFGKKIDVFIENTGRLISENIVNFDLLQKKCLEHNLEIETSETFGITYNKNKNEESMKEIEIDENLKEFSSLNRWCIFNKI
jgi:hypothetical protein